MDLNADYIEVTEEDIQDFLGDPDIREMLSDQELEELVKEMRRTGRYTP